MKIKEYEFTISDDKAEIRHGSSRADYGRYHVTYHGIEAVIAEVERLRDENQRLKDRPPVNVILTDEAARHCEVRAAEDTETVRSYGATIKELYGLLSRCVEAVGGGPSLLVNLEQARTVPVCVQTQFAAMKGQRDDAFASHRRSDAKIGDLRHAIMTTVKSFRDGDMIKAIGLLADLGKL